MEAAHSFQEPKPFRLDFSVSENRGEGTEEKPVLYYSRNGFVFRVQFDLHTSEQSSKIQISLHEKRRESLDRDWQILESEVQKLAEDELNKRLAAYSEYFAD